MTNGNRRSGNWAARLVAGLFLVHALLLGLSLGAAAHASERDRFGNLLCITTSDRPYGKDVPAGDHRSGLSDCCLLGCGSLAGGLAPPLATDIDIRHPAQMRSVPAARYDGIVPTFAASPRSSRGPPLST